MIDKYNVGTDYYKIGMGHNCPSNHVIDNKTTCNLALQALGLDPIINVENNFQKEDVNNTTRPAGCYFKSGKDGYFNKVVNPLLTDPQMFADRGGVCRKAGKNTMYQKSNKH